ncbi:MAG: hypothetical protein D6694_10800 [Gammaproteobacteria bacterium]|nr:MAG: hypothetical protein D6694_10800 [Gammaproteobacteria bacterium]
MLTLLVLGIGIGTISTMVFVDHIRIVERDVTVIPTTPPFYAYTAVQTHGLYPQAATAKGVEMAVVNAWLMETCGERTPWVPGYLFLVVEPQIVNHTDRPIPWSFALYDDVENKFVGSSAEECVTDPYKPVFTVLPAQQARGVLKFEIPPDVAGVHPHLQWKSDDLLVILDVFLDPGDIQLPSQEPRPQETPTSTP